MDYMKIINSRRFFIVFCLGAFAAWEFFRTPGPSPRQQMLEDQQKIIAKRIAATESDPEPWRYSETTYAYSVRERARKSIAPLVEKLEKEWWQICEANGHGNMVGTFGYYFEQRGMQIRNYAGRFGERGKRFATEAWSTSEDERVVQWVRDAYAKGRFGLEEFSPTTRETAASVLGVGPAPQRSCLP